MQTNPYTMKIPEATMKRRKNENTPYGNAEKERVIEGSETETAHQLGLLPEGQKTRENHNGIRYYVPKVDATEDDIDHTIKL